MQFFDQKTCSRLARALAVMCFRNTEVEDIHAGIWPSSKTGDYSDVRVIDAYGNEFTWAEISRISDEEMEVLNKTFCNRIYTFLMQGLDRRFDRVLNFYLDCAFRWDGPQIDPEVDCRGDHWDDLGPN
jgi:hypothetical protein